MREIKTESIETLGIIYDFDKWLYPTDTHCSVSENLVENVMQIKDYFDGFLVTPVAMYNDTIVTARSVVTDARKKSTESNFDQILEFVKKIKDNNKMIFLYQLSEHYSENKREYVLRYGKL